MSDSSQDKYGIKKMDKMPENKWSKPIRNVVIALATISMMIYVIEFRGKKIGGNPLHLSIPISSTTITSRVIPPGKSFNVRVTDSQNRPLKYYVWANSLNSTRYEVLDPQKVQLPGNTTNIFIQLVPDQMDNGILWYTEE